MVTSTTDEPGQSGETYLSRGQAAERLGVPPRMIQQWAKDGRIPFIRTFGGHRRFSPRDVDAMADWAKRRRRRPRTTGPGGP